MCQHVVCWEKGQSGQEGPVQKLFIYFLSFWTDVGYANDDFA